MTSRRITRRNVLRGAGGAVLAIPVLRSLLPADAKAHGGAAGAKRMVAIRTGHGGCWDSAFFPATPAETMAYAGHTIRRGDLVRTESDGMAEISPVLRARSSDFTAGIAAQLNVIRGIDSMSHVGHNLGAFLGNPNATDDEVTRGITTPRPTIDQVLAWSPWFYDDLSTTLERSIHAGQNVGFGWSSPQSQTGEIQGMATLGPLELFNLVFVPDEGELEQPRPLIVDRVLGEYRALREGNRRLSAGDRQRLDDHMERINELQRKLEIVVDCGSASPPNLPADVAPWLPGYYGDVDRNRAYWQAVNEVVAVAFACDTSRIAVLALSDQSTFSSYSGDWHGNIAHMANLTTAPEGQELPQAVLRDAYQRVFEDVFLDLVRRLDMDDGLGNSILDSSLVMWGQESGAETHDCSNMPLVTAGSAGGALRTGQNLDYRNLNSPFVDEYGGAPAPNGETVVTGLTTNQFLGSVLQAMGLPPEAYESGGVGGYGEAAPTPNRAGFYPASIRNRMGEMLPWFGA